MPHGLDHLVHAVRDLDAAADFYGRAGFTVGARNRHPWGTHNRVVQLRNCFVEILEVAEPDRIVAHGPRSFSFGAFNRDFISRREGLSMLLLNSTDAAADARAFETSGIGAFDVFDFGREGKRPDGTTVKLAFSLAFTVEPNSPDLCCAVCQHHYPENFWNPAFQTHANRVQGIPGIVLVADNPAHHQDYLGAYTGREPNRDTMSVVAHTENGDIEIMPPGSYRERFGLAVETTGDAATFNAIRFAVADLAQTEALLSRNAVTCRPVAGRLVVPPDSAFGATLIFEAATLQK